MSKGWAGGSTWAYRKVRDYVLARDRYACQIQIPGICVARADCVHHTKGRAATGDDPAYMVAACTPCNLKIGNPARDPIGRAMTRW
jgi:5-methylcytosine-specific restriction endonuclease McrA